MLVLKNWMAQQGLTNSALARRMGVSYDLVYSIVEGRRAVSDSFRWRFSLAFGVDTTTAIFGERQPSELEPAQ